LETFDGQNIKKLVSSYFQLFLALNRDIRDNFNICEIQKISWEGHIVKYIVCDKSQHNFTTMTPASLAVLQWLHFQPNKSNTSCVSTLQNVSLCIND
jgi:hypothetical protein